jgi:hypothetical protein
MVYLRLYSEKLLHMAAQQAQDLLKIDIKTDDFMMLQYSLISTWPQRKAKMKVWVSVVFLLMLMSLQVHNKELLALAGTKTLAGTEASSQSEIIKLLNANANVNCRDKMVHLLATFIFDSQLSLGAHSFIPGSDEQRSCQG